MKHLLLLAPLLSGCDPDLTLLYDVQVMAGSTPVEGAMVTAVGGDGRQMVHLTDAEGRASGRSDCFTCTPAQVLLVLAPGYRPWVGGAGAQFEVQPESYSLLATVAQTALRVQLEPLPELEGPAPACLEQHCTWTLPNEEVEELFLVEGTTGLWQRIHRETVPLGSSSQAITVDIPEGVEGPLYLLADTVPLARRIEDGGGRSVSGHHPRLSEPFMAPRRR